MDVAIGLVGCGRWGTNHHRILATLRTEGRIHRLVVCDIDASKTDGLEADAHYTSMEAMMANEQLHGVAIVTPLKLIYRSLSKRSRTKQRFSWKNH